MSPLFRALRHDPIWLREWRSSARQPRAPWLMAGGLLVVTWVLVMVGALGSFASPVRRGQTLAQIYLGAALLFVVLVGPALGASAVASEREGKTWEPLLMTGLDPARIDRGKFRAVYTELFLFLCMLLPAAALPHLTGGVTALETFLGIGMVFGLGALTVRFGLAVSAALPTARSALLVTVLLSVVLAMAGALLSALGARWLDHQDALAIPLASEAPIFWPFALARTALSFDVVRYLVVVPGLLYVIVWAALRRLSIAGMSERAADRTRQQARAFAVLVLPLSLTLGLLPLHHRSEAFALEIAIALVVFSELVVLAGAEHVGVRRGVFGLARAAAAFATLPAIAELLARTRGIALAPAPELHAMLLYGPSFAAFLYALDALLRARARARGPNTVRTARLVVIGAALGGAVLPLALSLTLGLLHDESAPNWPVGWSPLAVLNPESIGWEYVHRGVATWLGAAAVLATAAVALARRRSGLWTAPAPR